ncbi:MAG: hypothetical protein HY537_13145 [Deltaproteobacteria bacterium]|nr:hypothetical protein [Deltaproteobacteria bacterium]
MSGWVSALSDDGFTDVFTDLHRVFAAWKSAIQQTQYQHPPKLFIPLPLPLPPASASKGIARKGIVRQAPSRSTWVSAAFTLTLPICITQSCAALPSS